MDPAAVERRVAAATAALQESLDKSELEREEAEERLASVEAAIARARTEGSARALKAAQEAGAHEPEVIVEEIAEGIDTYRIRVRAVGTPRLGSH